MPLSHRSVQRLGLAIVAIGFVAAAAVHVSVRAGGDAEGDAVARQREMQQVERLGGRATVQTVKFDEWLGSLWEGERLAFTLAVLGVVVGGACWKVGSLMGEEDFDE
jgi:hypothetical protein